MTIIRPNSISGINSITAKNTDQMKLYDSNGAWSHVRAGVVTATSFSGPITGTTGNFGGDVTISGDLGVGGTITYEDVARVDATGISTFREGFKLGPLAGIALTAYKDGSIRTSGIVTAASFVGDGSGLTGAGPSLANGADNRVVTASSATALNGEANLTFDGTTLQVNGAGLFGTANTSKNTDGCIIERNSGDGLVHIAACRTGGNYSGINFYVSGDQGGAGANAKLRHLIDYQGNFRWYDSDGTTQRLHIDTNGDVIIGTSSWSYPKPLNVQGSSGAILALSNYDTTSYAQDTMTSIEFRLNTGNTGNQNGACEIRAFKANGTNGNNARSLSFYTGGNGGSPAERLRITSDGRLLVNTTANAGTAGGNYQCVIKTNGNDTWDALSLSGMRSGYAAIQCEPGADATYYPMYIRQHDSAYCGKISCYTNNTVSYDNASDYRLKQNDVAITDGIAKVKLLRPIRFEMKSDPGNQLEGFFAHEVQAAVPLSCAANGTKDQVDSDNNPIYQGMDYGKLTPILTAALKEAIAKIETLETEVAALKS